MSSSAEEIKRKRSRPWRRLLPARRRPIVTDASGFGMARVLATVSGANANRSAVPGGFRKFLAGFRAVATNLRTGARDLVAGDIGSRWRRRLRRLRRAGNCWAHYLGCGNAGAVDRASGGRRKFAADIRIARFGAEPGNARIALACRRSSMSLPRAAHLRLRETSVWVTTCDTLCPFGPFRESRRHAARTPVARRLRFGNSYGRISVDGSALRFSMHAYSGGCRKCGCGSRPECRKDEYPCNGSAEFSISNNLEKLIWKSEIALISRMDALAWRGKINFPSQGARARR